METTTEKTPTSKLSTLIRRAQQFPAISVAVVDAQGKHILEDVLEASDAGLIEPIFIESRVVGYNMFLFDIS